MTDTTHLVSPAEIHQKLNEIWESLDTTKSTRASLFNLIFYTQKNNRSAYAQKLVQKIVEKFPSRVIFICVDKQSKEDSLKTEVSILSSKQGEHDVACDYIYFEASSASEVRIPFLVLPHILPDLPVYLLWAEDPSKEDSLAPQLEQFSNRLIFDSESTDNLAKFATNLVRHFEESKTDIADLNWARIESWRNLFSMAFHASEKLEHIQQAKKIVLSYNAQESHFFCHTRIQAIYLQAWLACQLNWTYKSMRQENDQVFFTYQSPHTQVEVQLIPTHHSTLPPGLILNLDITTCDQQRYSFSRDPQEIHHITFQGFNAEKCELPTQYVLAKAESGHSLVNEICHRGTSTHFLKVLHMIKKMELC